MCLGVPGKLTEIYEASGLRMGKVDFGGITREACLEYLPEVKVGDYVIIHVGFAISQLSEKEAAETLSILREISDINAELGVEPSNLDQSRSVVGALEPVPSEPRERQRGSRAPEPSPEWGEGRPPTGGRGEGLQT